MSFLHWVSSNASMGLVISYLTISLILISGSFAQTSLYFTNTPSEVVVGTNYTINWRGGDYVSPVTLSLVQGDSSALTIIQTISSATTGTYCDWTPDSNLLNGDNYELMITQGGDVAYSPMFPITGGYTASSSMSSAATSSSMDKSAPTNTSAPSAAPTSQVTETPTPTPTPAPSSSSTSVRIIIPTPTSSFDAPVAADEHLTVNDKVAIGIGVPIALLVLGTVGYWRAVKFFFHRKITGDPKLPMYDAVVGVRDGAAGGGGYRNSSYSSRAPSLWGAASRRTSVNPEPFGEADTELLTTPPKVVHTSPDSQRASNRSSFRTPSALRQEWHAV